MTILYIDSFSGMRGDMIFFHQGPHGFWVVRGSARQRPSSSLRQAPFDLAQGKQERGATFLISDFGLRNAD